MQSDAQTLEEFIEALKSQHDDVVTLDDLPHEELAERYRHGIVSGYDWKHVLDECERHGVLFDVNDANSRTRGRWLGILMNEFVKEQDAELLRSLVESYDPEFTLNTLADSFLNAYCLNKDRLERAGLSQAPHKTHGFYAGLELMVQAFLNAQDLVPSSTLKSGLDSEAVEMVCHAILEEVAKTEKARYNALRTIALDRHADHRKAFEWEGDHSSHSALSAQAKAKLFMKYVTQVKAAGVPMMKAAVDTAGNIVAICVRYFSDIHFHKDNLKRVTELFEKRPWITVWLLSRGFFAYVGMFIKGLQRDGSFKKDCFYSTKVVAVSWFLTHLDRIVDEMERYNRESHRRLSAPP